MTSFLPTLFYRNKILSIYHNADSDPLLRQILTNTISNIIAIMMYRFLIVGYDNEYHSVKKEFSSYGDALIQVKLFLSDVDSVKSIDLYRLTSDDSCGPMTWVGMFDLNTVLIPTGMLDEIKGK